MRALASFSQIEHTTDLETEAIHGVWRSLLTCALDRYRYRVHLSSQLICLLSLLDVYPQSSHHITRWRPSRSPSSLPRHSSCRCSSPQFMLLPSVSKSVRHSSNSSSSSSTSNDNATEGCTMQMIKMRNYLWIIKVLGSIWRIKDLQYRGEPYPTPVKRTREFFNVRCSRSCCCLARNRMVHLAWCWEVNR